MGTPLPNNDAMRQEDVASAFLADDDARANMIKLLLPTSPPPRLPTSSPPRTERKEDIVPSKEQGLENGGVIPKVRPQIPNEPNITLPQVTLESMQQLVVQNSHALQMISQLLGNSQKPKLLSPEKYCPSSSTNFLTFFTKFEAYTNAMYPGSSSEMGSFLGKYLEGPALEIYRSIRNRTDDYYEIKQKLLRWQEDEESKSKGQQDIEFMEAIMKPDEPVHVYASRLLTLAQRCLPNIDVTRVPMVINKFVAGLTPILNGEVKRVMLMQEATLGVQLPWDRLVAVADKSAALCCSPMIQTQFSNPTTRQPEVVDIATLNHANMYALSNPTGMTGTNFNAQPPNYTTPSYDSYQVNNSQFSKIPQQVPQFRGGASNNNFTQRKPSYHGSNRGGTNFQKSKTNKPKSNFESQSYSNYEMNWYCRFCKERGHTYGNCPERILCTWCSRRGHTFQECYTAQGICILCKQSGHLPKDCPSKRTDETIQVSCPGCTGPHFGKDCTSTKGLPGRLNSNQGQGN